MHSTYKSEKEEEEVEGSVLGYGVAAVSIVAVVYPRGTVSISSLGYFSSFGSSSKPHHPSFPLSLGARHVQEYFKKNRGRKRKCVKT